MQHLTKKLTLSTARLLIALPPPACAAIQPSIIRHRLDPWGNPAKSPGAVVGLEKGMPYALVLNVKIGDLISLSDPADCGFTPAWKHFRIATGFGLAPFETQGRELSPEECRTHVTSYEPLKQPGSSDAELQTVFRPTDYPEFLPKIFDRHIRNQQENEPGQYFQLVPWRITDEEIPDLVRTAPIVALEFHRSKLDAEQIA